MDFRKSVQAVALVTILMVTPASGQSSESALIGVGFGRVHMGRDGTSGTWGNAIYVNARTPRNEGFLLGVDLSYWWRNKTNFQTSQFTVAPAVYLASDLFFLKGTLGYAHRSTKREFLPDRSVHGFVLGLGVGHDLRLGERWLVVPVIDLGVRGFSSDVAGFFSGGLMLSRH